MDQELGFQDKYLFYRFLDDEEEDTPLPSEEEKRESEDELPETILFLAQIGPDALLRMILRKSSVTTTNRASCTAFISRCTRLHPMCVFEPAHFSWAGSKSHIHLLMLKPNVFSLQNKLKNWPHCCNDFLGVCSYLASFTYTGNTLNTNYNILNAVSHATYSIMFKWINTAYFTISPSYHVSYII